MQNAYSEQGSLEIEQQLGARSTLSAGYQHLRGLHLIISVNQNVPDLRGLRHQQRLPAESELCQQQPVFVAGGFPLRRPARLLRAAARRVGQLPRLLHLFEIAEQCRRVLLQLPDRQFNIWQDYGRSDDDQRHRVVFDGAVPQLTAFN